MLDDASAPKACRPQNFPRIHSVCIISELKNSGHFFDLETGKGWDSEDACRCVNELMNELTEGKKRSGRQSAAPS